MTFGCLQKMCTSSTLAHALEEDDGDDQDDKDVHNQPNERISRKGSTALGADEGCPDEETLLSLVRCLVVGVVMLFLMTLKAGAGPRWSY